MTHNNTQSCLPVSIFATSSPQDHTKARGLYSQNTRHTNTGQPKYWTAKILDSQNTGWPNPKWPKKVNPPIQQYHITKLAPCQTVSLSVLTVSSLQKHTSLCLHDAGLRETQTAWKLLEPPGRVCT